MRDDASEEPAADIAGRQGSAPEPATATAPLPERLEAILLVVDEPQSLLSLASALGEPVEAVRAAVQALVADYEGRAGGPRRGFELREVGGGWRLYVRAEHDALVTEFVSAQGVSRLSPAALETLAVVAYRQPISRGAIASIRAVNVDSVVRTLVSRGLIEEAATDAETGAILYGTTPALLSQLGINSLDELPPIAPLLDDGTAGFDGEPG